MKRSLPPTVKTDEVSNEDLKATIIGDDHLKVCACCNPKITYTIWVECPSGLSKRRAYSLDLTKLKEYTPEEIDGVNK